MQSMTLEQLRATVSAGGVVGVTLKGRAAVSLWKLPPAAGKTLFLVKSRGTEPRRFGSPNSALMVLRDLGIDVAQVDATNWNPDQKEVSQNRDSRAQAMRLAHEAAAYNHWLVGEIQEAIDDPRPSVPHDKVMARMDARIERHKTAGAKRA